jgi:hypothetical protein
MATIMGERGFDVAGVKDAPQGPVVGFVLRDSLQAGYVREHTKPLNADHLISDATSLGDLLTVLHTKERVFVLAGSEVRGIVTRADLNKPPVRIYLFGLVSLLEMHLGFWVRNSYGGDSWKQQLHEKRLKDAEKLHTQRRTRNDDITLLDCLQFCDKRDLVMARSELCTKLGLESKIKARKLFEDAEALRNLLAHSQLDLVQGSSWPELIELIEEIEALVHRSDDAVEQEAKSLSKSVDELWVVS